MSILNAIFGKKEVETRKYCNSCGQPADRLIHTFDMRMCPRCSQEANKRGYP